MTTDDLKKFKDTLAMDIYNMTPKEAISKGICIQCKQPAFPRIYSKDGQKEFMISGLCELCFDEICDDLD